MNRLAVDELKEGMRFSRPVYIDDENLFVPEGFEIKERDLKRLRKLGIDYVLTDGEPLGDNPLAGMNAFFLKAFTSPVQRTITRTYTEQKEAVRSVFGRIRAKEGVSQDEVNEIVDALVGLLDRSTGDVIQYMIYGMQGETGDIENALNSTLLSALVGRAMQLPHHRVQALATAALLHDVGMLRINPAIVSKKGKLTDDELRQIRTHPVHSYQIITRELRYPDDIGVAALQHQERWDGNGYPRHLTKEQISVEARILAVSDSFVAMVSNRPYRTSMIGYSAMRNLLSDNGTRFSPEVLKVFIRVLGIYPIGSIVLLSDSSVARVIENHPEAPLKPVVKIIIDADGNDFPNDDGAENNLLEQKKLFIAKAVDANSLANDAGRAGA